MPAENPSAPSRTGGSLLAFVAPAGVPAEPDFDALADTLLAVADEVADAEAFLRDAAVEAIDAGNADRAREILARWRTEPATEIAASLGGKRCG